MRHWMVSLILLFFSSQLYALDLSSLTKTEASGGIKEALIQGAKTAVNNLGAENGFYGNKEVKIPLPENMKRVSKMMRMFGMGKQVDALELKMNRAAEAAVPEAKNLLVNSVKNMSVTDAKKILTGGDDAGTQYFKRTTENKMRARFLPIVHKATEDVQLAQQYNQYAKMGAKYGLVKGDQASLEEYVTQKALDGVYLMIAKEEAAIRKDPVGQGSQLLKKVFGALQ